MPHLGRMAVSSPMEGYSFRAYKEVSEVNHQVKREVARRVGEAREQAVALYLYVSEMK